MRPLCVCVCDNCQFVKFSLISALEVVVSVSCAFLNWRTRESGIFSLLFYLYKWVSDSFDSRLTSLDPRFDYRSPIDSRFGYEVIT